MSNTSWNKTQAIKAMRIFYGTIETSVEDLNVPGRYWRRVTVGSQEVSAFYDKPSLDMVVSALLANAKIADNYLPNALDALVGEGLIAAKLIHKKVFDEVAEALIDQIIRIPSTPKTVYMSFKGLALPEGVRRKVGDFLFVSGDGLELLKLKCPHPEFQSWYEKLWDKQPHVAVTVRAVDANMAREKAKEEFLWLENAVRLFQDSGMHDFGVTSYNFTYVENAIVTDENGLLAGASSSLKGAPDEIPFDKALGKDSSLRSVIETLGHAPSELNEVQKKLRQAVYLGGLSVHEQIPEISYFLVVSAFEALFSFSNGPYVSPSISQRILEAICYLVTEPDRRRSTFEFLKKFYEKRSAIVHGGTSEVGKEESRLLRGYLRAAVVKLITDPELSKVTKMDGLSQIILARKFGPLEDECNTNI